MAPQLKPTTIINLTFIGMAGWLLILFGSPIGLGLILAADLVVVWWLTRKRLAQPGIEGGLLQNPELLMLWALYAVEAFGAARYFESRWQGVIILLLVEMASAAWVFERGLMKWPPDEDDLP